MPTARNINLAYENYFGLTGARTYVGSVLEPIRRSLKTRTYAEY